MQELTARLKDREILRNAILAKGYECFPCKARTLKASLAGWRGIPKEFIEALKRS